MICVTWTRRSALASLPRSERLAANDPSVDVRTLTGSDELRLRVGDWRVRFVRDTAERQLVILRVLPRGRAYDR